MEPRPSGSTSGSFGLDGQTAYGFDSVAPALALGLIRVPAGAGVDDRFVDAGAVVAGGVSVTRASAVTDATAGFLARAAACAGVIVAANALAREKCVMSLGGPPGRESMTACCSASALDVRCGRLPIVGLSDRNWSARVTITLPLGVGRTEAAAAADDAAGEAVAAVAPGTATIAIPAVAPVASVAMPQRVRLHALHGDEAGLYLSTFRLLDG